MLRVVVEILHIQNLDWTLWICVGLTLVLLWLGTWGVVTLNSLLKS